MASKAVEKAMHAYLISEAETEERRAQRLRSVAAALEESLANGACVGCPAVLFDHVARRRKVHLVAQGQREMRVGLMLSFGVHFFKKYISHSLHFSGDPHFSSFVFSHHSFHPPNKINRSGS